MIKPPSLEKGDKVAIASFGGALASVFPQRLERGMAALRNLGYQPVPMPSLKKNLNGRPGCAHECADELHTVFSDPDIKAVIAAIGGYSANEMLPLLDFDFLRRNPTIFCGYSDNTLIVNALAQQAGLIAFYGPCVMTQFGEFPKPHPYTVKSFLTIVQGSHAPEKVNRSSDWSDEFVDWSMEPPVERYWNFNDDDPVWLNGGLARERKLVGGCLASILQVAGTPFELQFEGNIVVLETGPGESPNRSAPLQQLRAQFFDLKLNRSLRKAAGIVIGRPFGMTPDQKAQFFIDLREAFSELPMPILFNANVGHVDPIATLPIGARATLDAALDIFEISETAVTAR